MIEVESNFNRTEVQAGGFMVWLRQSRPPVECFAQGQVVLEAGTTVGEIDYFSAYGEGRKQRLLDTLNSFAALADYFLEYPAKSPQYLLGHTNKEVALLAVRIGFSIDPCFESEDYGDVIGETDVVIRKFAQNEETMRGILERKAK